MSIEDLTKAFWILNADPLAYCINIKSIQDGKIYFDNGQIMEIQELVEVYNEEYGE